MGSSLVWILFSFFCSFHLPPTPHPQVVQVAFPGTCPALRISCHPPSGTQPPGEGEHSWRPSQELRVRAGRHEAVDIFGVFWFGFCFFLNRAILCSVQAVKKNIYQCFPIKYSDYLMGSGPLVLVSGLAPPRTLQPWPGRAFLPCSLQSWILITATSGGPVSWSLGPSQRGHSGLSAHHTSARDAHM